MALSTSALFVIYSSLIGINTAFLTNTNCVVPSPCTCSSHAINCYSKQFCSSYTINCNSKQLSQVPAFSRQNAQHHCLHLNMRRNQLTSLPAYAFLNLSTVNASTVYIDLSDNQIAIIEPHAFSGIEHAVESLDLNRNNITHLPLALAELSALQYLYLLNNPIVNLNAIVLANVSSKLNILYLSLEKFSIFPTELSVLTKLTTLGIDNVRFRLQPSVFYSFENSLSVLGTSYARFESIPATVCRLKVLTQFDLSYSPSLGKYNGSIFDECTYPMDNVTYLVLQHDQLTIFPSRLATVFPKLQNLDLSNNLLYSIDSTSMAGLSSLPYLNIGSNQFLKVPSAINNATNLEVLKINNNKIQMVGYSDLQHLHKLTFLALDDNPLTYLSSYSLSNCPSLSIITLSNTMLEKIPRAILRLRKLGTVSVSGKPIECSCSAMSYLKRWYVLPITIYATCSSGKPVKTYLTNDLPNCV